MNKTIIVSVTILILILSFSHSGYGIESLDVERYLTDEEYRNYWDSHYATSASQLIEGTVEYAAQVNSLVAGWQSPKVSEELGPDAPKLLAFTVKALEISDALAGADSVLNGLWNIQTAIVSWKEYNLDPVLNGTYDWIQAELEWAFRIGMETASTQTKICELRQKIRGEKKKLIKFVNNQSIDPEVRAEAEKLYWLYVKIEDSLEESEEFVSGVDSDVRTYIEEKYQVCFPDGCETKRCGTQRCEGPGCDHPDETTAVVSTSTQFYPYSSDTRQTLLFLSKLYERSPDYDEHQRLAEQMRLKLNESIAQLLLENSTGNITGETLAQFWSSYRKYLLVSRMVSDDLSRASDTVLFSSDFYLSTEKLLAELGEHHTNVPPAGPVLVEFPEHQKVLIIPTGGLYGLDSDEIFRAKLEKFVSEGGVLIVFAQQHGYEFQALPGGKVSGYGWLEDQSCFSKAVYIDTYHPVLAGQDSVLMDINIDGYFTSWPENATVLFSRTANGMPAGIMYRYGKGWVVATTAYTDWAFAHGQRTGDGLAFVRDLLAWAVAESEGMEIPEYGHGDTANISVTITNRANSTATAVVFSVIDPNKNIVSNFSVPVIIASGETKTVYASYLIRSESGIWSVDYALVNATNETIQVGYDVARFVMKGVQNMSNEEFQSWITKRFYTLSIKKVEGSSKGVIE